MLPNVQYLGLRYLTAWFRLYSLVVAAAHSQEYFRRLAPDSSRAQLENVRRR